MARTTTLLLLMLSFSSPSFLISFFGAHAVPIDLTTTNSSSPEFLGSRMFTPENAKQANFLLGYTYVNTEIGTDYNTATQFTAAHHFEEDKNVPSVIKQMSCIVLTMCWFTSWYLSYFPMVHLPFLLCPIRVHQGQCPVYDMVLPQSPLERAVRWYRRRVNAGGKKENILWEGIDDERFN
ncbi:hypothetical protein GG344DRAFT_68728 [Lentinula edodes]|nr:hypothetical protein GG344DRAFT_68728 [Lentinula edodes]